MPNNYISHIRRTYGIEERDYDAQAQAQNYLCAVCEEQNPVGRDGQPRKLNVDHNHRTNANRDLLCERCNKVLGFVKDSQEILLRLLEYVRRHDGSDISYTPDNYITRASRDAAFEQSLGLSASSSTADGEISSHCEQAKPLCEFD